MIQQCKACVYIKIMLKLNGSLLLLYYTQILRTIAQTSRLWCRQFWPAACTTATLSIDPGRHDLGSQIKVRRHGSALVVSKSVVNRRKGHGPFRRIDGNVTFVDSCVIRNNGFDSAAVVVLILHFQFIPCRFSMLVCFSPFGFVHMRSPLSTHLTHAPFCFDCSRLLSGLHPCHLHLRGIFPQLPGCRIFQLYHLQLVDLAVRLLLSRFNVSVLGLVILWILRCIYKNKSMWAFQMKR